MSSRSSAPPESDPVALLKAGDREGAVGAFFSTILDDWREAFSSVPGGVEQAKEDIDTVLHIEVPAMAAFHGDIRAVTMPFLMIWGEKSPLYAEGSGDMLRDVVPQAEFRVIDGAGHSIVSQRPAEVAAAMAAFFARHPM